MCDMLQKISVRTATTVVTVLIGIVLTAIVVMSYLVFLPEDSSQGSGPRLAATALSWPSATASHVLETPYARFTPFSEEKETLIPTLSALDIAPSGGGQGNAAHPTIEPTDQPCENCHQDLRGGG